MNIYIEEGYKNRRDYLENLSEEFNIPFTIVSSIAELLGPKEDFDGLISSLEDFDGLMSSLEDFVEERM